MSWEIIYDRAFIKVSDKQTIPFLLMGSNNCYDYNGKRARDWQNVTFHSNGIIGNNDAIIKSIDDYRNTLIERDSSYVDKYFGYYASLSLNGRSTTKTSFSAYKSYFVNGIKRAKTIEEYKELSINFKIGVCSYDRKTMFEDKGIEFKNSVQLNDTKHLIEQINLFEDYYKPFGYTVYLSGDITEYDAKRLKVKRIRG